MFGVLLVQLALSTPAAKFTIDVVELLVSEALLAMLHSFNVLVELLAILLLVGSYQNLRKSLAFVALGHVLPA